MLEVTQVWDTHYLLLLCNAVFGVKWGEVLYYMDTLGTTMPSSYPLWDPGIQQHHVFSGGVALACHVLVAMWRGCLLVEQSVYLLSSGYTYEHL